MGKERLAIIAEGFAKLAMISRHAQTANGAKAKKCNVIFRVGLLGEEALKAVFALPLS
jgi:hypothetical protein